MTMPDQEPIPGQAPLPVAEEVPDWLKNLESEDVGLSTVAPSPTETMAVKENDLPAWLRPAAPPVPIGEGDPDWLKPLRKAAEETEPKAPDGLKEEEPRGLQQSWNDELARTDRKQPKYVQDRIEWAEGRRAGGTQFINLGDETTNMPIDEYIGRLQEILAAKEQPEVPFHVRISSAAQAARTALRVAGSLPKKLAERRTELSERRRQSPQMLAESEEGGERAWFRIPEMPDDDLATVKRARDILSPYFGSHDIDIDIGIGKVIGLQEQYRQGREWADANNQLYESRLTASARELKPGWFEKEPAVYREMRDLNAFFARVGDREEIDRRVAGLRDIDKNPLWNILDRKQRDAMLADRTQALAELASLENLEGLLARKDLPPILQTAIEAARAGKQYDFGSGQIAQFRRQVYESIVDALGVKIVPAVEVSPIAAPAIPEPTPEPEPTSAPVETLQERKFRAINEFLGETQIPELENLSNSQASMLEGVRKKQRSAEQAAKGLAQRAEDNPGQRAAILTVAKQTVDMVLREAYGEKDPKKQRLLLNWTKEFGAALGGTSLGGELSMQAFNVMMELIVAELSGK